MTGGRAILIPLLCLVVRSSGAPLLEVPDVVSVCDLLSHASRYDGRLVHVRDRVEGTDEGRWFVGDECPAVFKTNGDHVWPSSVFLATPSATVVGRTRLHEVDFEYDLAGERRLEPKIEQLRAKFGDRCLAWAYTGVFETRTNWAAAKVEYPNGTLRIIGFGHGGEAPAQLILKSFDDVSALPTCAAPRDVK